MYKDIDRLMQKMGISALYAEGSPQNDATMYYLLKGAHISAYYIKRRGKPACVVHSPIEREVAAQTGHRLISANQYDFQRFKSKRERGVVRFPTHGQQLLSRAATHEAEPPDQDLSECWKRGH